MTEKVQAPPRTPWHLWVVGSLAVLWNGMGALDFTMTETHNETYLEQFTPEQIVYFDSFPTWAVIAWCVATWGSLIGSLLLIFRSAQVLRVYLVSIVAMIASAVHNFILTDGLEMMGGGAGPVLFTALVWVAAFLLFYYAFTMTRRGVLR